MTKPHSDECRARMDELMQRDEDALVQQRLHADRLRRGSTVAGSSALMRSDQACRKGAAEMHPESEAHTSPRAQEQKWQGVAVEHEPMGTAAEDADVRRGLKRSADLPLDDRARDRAPGRGEHLDEDVPTVTPIVQRAEQTQDSRVKITKILGILNLADFGTMHFEGGSIRRALERCHCYVREGRSGIACNKIRRLHPEVFTFDDAGELDTQSEMVTEFGQ